MPTRKKKVPVKPINPGFWEQDPKRVAVDLLGRVMQVGELFATILEARGYAREENSGLYGPVLTLSSGSVYCPRRHNTLLVLIATHDQGAPGGCVLIREVEIDGVLYKGPGKVSASLGIDRHGVSGSTAWLDEEAFRIEMSAELHPSVKPSGRKRAKVAPDANSIGRETLRRFMVQIVRKYARDSQGIPFHDFLNSILQTCKSPNDLRKFLR